MKFLANFWRNIFKLPHSFYFLVLILLCLFAQISHGKPVDSKQILQIEKYLETYEGYSKPEHAHGSSRIDPTSTEEFKQAVMHLQLMAGLPQTGELNDETLNVMKKPRCGNPDRLPKENSNRKKRYATHFDSWEKTHLTYTIHTHTNDIEKLKIEEHFKSAFDIWTKHSPLSFERVDANADLRINFTYGEHGDGYPFPENGNTIAHAFYPQTELEGQIHFNDIVTFTNEKDYNLLQLATHEIGHSLGLRHTAVQEAIMVPFYWFRENFDLHQDDKDGIESLYGPKPIETTAKAKTTAGTTESAVTSVSRTANPTESSTAEEKSTISDQTTQEKTTVQVVKTTMTPQQRLCSLEKVNAILPTHDGFLYIFIQDYVYVLEPLNSGNLVVLEGYPKLISEEFIDAPSNLNAAIYVNFEFYLIKNDEFYVYDEDKNHIFTGIIDVDGFYGVPHNIDSAFIYSGNQLVHFSKGNHYYLYDLFYVNNDNYPKSLDEFIGGPFSLDAAFLFNGYTHFVNGRNYYVIDDKDMTVFQDYPKDFFHDFLDCPKEGDNSEKPVMREPNIRKGPVPQPKIYNKDKLDANRKNTKLRYKRNILPSSSSRNYNYNPLLLIIPVAFVHIFRNF